jgi:dihydroorotase-like cyclic amidohydrolase
VTTLRVVNALLVTPAGVREGGVWSEDGVIGLVGDSGQLPGADTTIDAAGRFLLPGLIDPHVHLGTGGSADDAKFLQDLGTETQAAAAGGITTIVTDHENAHGQSWITTLIERDGETLLQHAKRAITGRSPVDVRYTANPSSARHLEEMPRLVEASVTSYKMFPSYVGEEAEEFGIATVGMDYIYEALEVIASLDRPWRPTTGMVHCEEPSVCALLKARLRKADSSLRAWTRARPAICEAMQIGDVGLIAKETGARMYIPHVSSEEGVRMIEYLQARGARIAGETCPHYLVSEFPWQVGTFGKVNPPVRNGPDRDQLWRALSDNRLEALGSDNCRFRLAEKTEKDVWDAIPGFSEIYLSLPLMLTEGIRAGRIDWPTLARIASENPARCFAMYPKKGALQPGSDADLTIVAADERWTVRAKDFAHPAEYSLYEGMEMTGRSVMSIRRGEVVAEPGWIAAGGGTYVDTPSPAVAAR